MNIPLYTKTFVPGLLAALVISIVAGSYGQNLLGQTADGQTSVARANVTAADFNAVTDALMSARLGILNNDSVLAYNSINTADTDLFGLGQSVASGNESLVKQINEELGPIHNSIVNARKELRDENNTQALRQLNNADLRLLNITQGLASGEE